MAVMGEGGWKFFTGNGGNGVGVGFIMGGGGGWGIFSLYIVDRRVLTPVLWRPPILLTPFPFSNFVQPPLLYFPVTSNLPPQLFFLLSCFFDWLGDHATFDVLFYLMLTWIYTFQALVPRYENDLDMCFMQQGIRFTEVWHIMWFFIGTLIWYHKHTTTHTAHSRVSGLTHPYKCIFTPLVMCSK